MLTTLLLLAEVAVVLWVAAVQVGF